MKGKGGRELWNQSIYLIKLQIKYITFFNLRKCQGSRPVKSPWNIGSLPEFGFYGNYFIFMQILVWFRQILSKPWTIREIWIDLSEFHFHNLTALKCFNTKLIEALWWQHRLSVNIGSYYGLLPNKMKPLPESVSPGSNEFTYINHHPGTW